MSPDLIKKIQECYRAAIDGEVATALAHQSNPYFASNGRNVSNDEYTAVHYAGKVSLVPSDEESKNPQQYAERILADLEAAKSSYRMSEDDPDGFGIGTLHGISREFSAMVKRHL